MYIDVAKSCCLSSSEERRTNHYIKDALSGIYTKEWKTAADLEYSSLMEISW